MPEKEETIVSEKHDPKILEVLRNEVTPMGIRLLDGVRNMFNGLTTEQSENLNHMIADLLRDVFTAGYHCGVEIALQEVLAEQLGKMDYVKEESNVQLTV